LGFRRKQIEGVRFRVYVCELASGELILQFGRIGMLTILFLLLALLPLPYAYYQFLRWAVTISCVTHLVVSLRQLKAAASLIFVVIALVFNPIEPFFLSRATWVIIDIVAALAFKVGLEEIEKTA